VRRSDQVEPGRSGEIRIYDRPVATDAGTTAGTTDTGTGPATWPQRVDELAAAHPLAVALTTTARGGETLTWQQLAERSRAVAARLRDLGVEPGRVVCVELPNRAAHVVTTFGAWRLGATVLPLRPDLPAAERERLLALARPAVVVVDREPATDREAAADALVEGPSAPAADFPPVVADPGWLIASGGSTGAPKLIASSTTTLLGPSAIERGRPLFVDTTGHRHPAHLVCSPLYHTQGFALLHNLLLEDGRIVLTTRFDVEEVLDVIETERVAFAAFVPTMLVRLLRSPTLAGRDLSSLEHVVQGAGATPEWAIRRWLDLVGPERFVMGYGSSEGVCSAQIRGDDWLRHPGSVGRPTGTDVLVVDESGEPLPVGEVGELYFRPTRGDRPVRYVGDAEPRALPGGWVSIGDLGRVDAEGYLYIADRRTDMVKTGGANVFVSEVEAVLLLHPGVTDAVVVGLRDAEWGRRVHAIVQPAPGADRDGLPEALRAHCKEHLTGYKVPRTVEVVADLGRSDTGKINRRALAEARDAASTTES
jgi:bile acid-coenzyme A ligase